MKKPKPDKIQKKRISLFLILITFVSLSLVLGSCEKKVERTGPLKVACVGASNTRGFNIPDLDNNCYPGQLQTLAGEDWEVFNAGVGGTTALKEGSISYWKSLALRQSLAFEPDVVIIDFGWNDVKPQNRVLMEENFVKDYTALIEEYSNLPSKPKMFMTLPPLLMNSEFLEGEYQFLLGFYNEIMKENDITPIDLYTPMGHEKNYFTGDLVHYSVEGCGVAAAEVYKVVMENIDD